METELNAHSQHEGPTFADFSGVCHGEITRAPLWGKTLGWDRFDLNWHELEPQRGEWRSDRLREFIEHHIGLTAVKQVKFLPILDYGTLWSAGEIPDQCFTLDEVKYEIKRDSRGDFSMRLFHSHQGRESLAFAERKIPAEDMMRHYLGAEYVKDWENYVRRVVAALRQVGVGYFQVWNEAHPTSSFWYGDMDTYFNRVHKPAANIIRELGGKVVYGGWICGAPLSQMIKLFDRHQVWESIDVIDIHYFPLAGWEYLRRELQKRKLTHLGMWQTEVGFSSNPNYVGNFYPRALSWALKHGWDRKDKYKLFYFPYAASDDPAAYGYGRALLSGDTLNQSGKALETLSELLGDTTLSSFEGVNSEPKLQAEIDERLSSMESFRSGHRIVTACHFICNNSAKIFVNWNEDLDTLHLDHDAPEVRLHYELPYESVEKVERVSMLGSRRRVHWQCATNGELTTRIPVREEQPDFPYTDMPENFLPEVFYVVVTLKDDTPIMRSTLSSTAAFQTFDHHPLKRSC